MSKSALLSSSIAKKWWMALTGLFLCTFLLGHLFGNLLLIFITGKEGQLAFNEYAYFMSHNPFIKFLSYATYISIIFHSIDGFLLAVQNKKARPVKYVYNNPAANTKLPSRYMAILGTLILVFIVTHMANFWWKVKFSSDPFPLQKEFVKSANVPEEQVFYVTLGGQFLPVLAFEGQAGADPEMIVKNETDLYNREFDIKIGEGYKDLHSVVMAFFGQDKSKEAGLPANSYALLAVIAYALAMAVLSFHLYHGFASSFQSLGINHRKYTPIIKKVGVAFAVLVPFGFAIIPILIYSWK